MNLEQELPKKIDDLLLARNKTHPCHTNRASDLGHPCLRFLFYVRTSWDKRQRPTLDALYRMNEGVEQERILIRQLMEAGYDITCQQQTLFWKEYNITGHFEGNISRNGSIPALIEIKSMSTMTYDKLNEPKDFLNQFWHEKWYAQIQIYLILREEERGYFFLKNRDNGKIKVIPIELDYDYAEKLIQKAVLINDHVECDEPPGRLQNEMKICQMCDFLSICCPPLERQVKTVVMDEGELAGMCALKLHLDPLVSNCKKLNDEIRDISFGHEEILAGPYRITGKQLKKYWKYSIEKVL